MRIAIIDLGTNTFNLLLVDVLPDKSYTTLYTARHAVKIGERGINKHLITPEATRRAVKTIQFYLNVIEEYGGASEVYAIATSAVRSANNKDEFIATIGQHTGLKIQVISGDEEATLIYRGVRQSLDIGREPVLILDIGGGSNELIIANNRKIFWKHSFPLGIARIVERFQPEDPVTPDTLQQIEDYFTGELSMLWNEAANYTIDTLIGSSGSFDTYRTVLCKNKCIGSLYCDIPLEDYFALHQKFIQSTYKQRMLIKGLELPRVEMITIASIFTNLILRKLNIKTLIQSEYSLKEGAVYSILKNELI